MGCALGEVLDNTAYVPASEISATGMCSLLEGLRINFKFSGYLELSAKELWKAAVCFRGGGGR